MNSTMIHSAIALAKKDLRTYFRDRSALVLGFLVPITLVTVFGWLMAYAFGGQGGMPKISMWVVDEANTEASRQMVADLRKSTMLQILPKEDSPSITSDMLKTKIADGDAHHGLIIPKEFGTTSSGDQNIDLKMIRDPGREMEDRIIQFGLMQTLMTNSNGSLWQQSLRKMFQKQGMDSDQLVRLDEALGSATHTIRDFLTSDANTNQVADQSSTEPKEAKVSGVETSSSQEDGEKDEKGVDPMQFMSNMLPIENEDVTPPKRSKMVTYQQAQSVSGMSVMMLMFGLTGAGSLLLAEKEQGTLRRLLALPIPRESILLGKFFFVFVVGISQMLVMMTYGEWMFRVGLWRDPMTTILLAITWVAAAGSFGLFIATFSSSAKQADGLSTIIVLAMAALGGCWFPVQQMNLPLPLEIASKSTMTFWAMEGFQGLLWNNLSWMDGKILKCLAVLSIWTAALATASTFFFRRNYLR